MKQTVSLWTLPTILLVVCTIVLTSCKHDMDDYKKQPYDVTDEERVAYAEKILETTIDPEQNWELTSECSVTITANARLDNISMVAVLQGNPYGGESFILQRPHFQELVYVPRGRTSHAQKEIDGNTGNV